MDPIARGLSLALKRLPSRERKVLWLRYEMKMEFADIAKEIGITKRKTAEVYDKAMVRLAKVLEIDGSNAT